MKKEIHPAYKPITFVCSCGSKFTTQSTLSGDTYNVEVCSKCHPFYTGKQKLVDTSGQLEKFKKRFGGVTKKEKVTEEATGA